MDLVPKSPTLSAVNIITSKLFKMESNGDQTERTLMSREMKDSEGIYSLNTVMKMAKDRMFVKLYTCILLLSSHDGRKQKNMASASECFFHSLKPSFALLWENVNHTQ